MPNVPEDAEPSGFVIPDSPFETAFLADLPVVVPSLVSSATSALASILLTVLIACESTVRLPVAVTLPLTRDSLRESISMSATPTAAPKLFAWIALLTADTSKSLLLADLNVTSVPVTIAPASIETKESDVPFP